MATAIIYDGYEDVGMAFTDADLDAYDPALVAAQAAQRLLGVVPVVARLRQLGAPKPMVWVKVQAKIVDCATWHCLVGELPGIDRAHVADLPSPSSAAGKALTVHAHQVISSGCGVFLAEWRVAVCGELGWMVTIGRRKCSSRRSPKSERSKMNKVANALVRELNIIEKLQVLESSTSGSSSPVEAVSDV
jgi:hypothetical protein